MHLLSLDHLIVINYIKRFSKKYLEISVFSINSPKYCISSMTAQSKRIFVF